MTGSLARRLGTRDAVVIGLGSMIGAGVFASFGPAAAAAGSGLLIGLALAAGVAYCNAVASAQLAAQYPTSGGTYVYGRERLGPWWGFTAGWGFVIGKTASCAAMALTFASYAVGGSLWKQRLVGVAAVAVLTAVNYRGITRTARLARVLVSVSILALVVIVVALVTSGGAHTTNLSGLPFGRGGVYGIAQSAGLLFFAFAGYARIATLGEEVRDPAVTIPRAIPIALGITIAIYAALGVSMLLAAGPAALAGSRAPVVGALVHAGANWASPAARVGAVFASLGALLALIAGVGRTTLAMARERDLPSWLASVHPVHRVPDHAELALGVVVSVLVLTTDLRGAIGFSSFGVLAYYAIANASAFTQAEEHRRWPRAFNVVGLLACLALMATLPWHAVIAGSAVLAAGLGARFVRVRSRGT